MWLQNLLFISSFISFHLVSNFFWNYLCFPSSFQRLSENLWLCHFLPHLIFYFLSSIQIYALTLKHEFVHEATLCLQIHTKWPVVTFGQHRIYSSTTAYGWIYNYVNWSSVYKLKGGWRPNWIPFWYIQSRHRFYLWHFCA